MTTYESEEDRRRALKAGAEAYLVKGNRPQEIREAVRASAPPALRSALKE